MGGQTFAQYTGRCRKLSDGTPIPVKGPRMMSEHIWLGDALCPTRDAPVEGGFVDVDGEPFARIANVDAMPPFLMSVVCRGDVWLFVGSNGAFTAGRVSPEGAIFRTRPPTRSCAIRTARGQCRFSSSGAAASGASGNRGRRAAGVPPSPQPFQARVWNKRCLRGSE